MRASPDIDDFARRYTVGEPQVVSARLIADLETPVSAMLKLAHERPYSFLLESVEGGAIRGRYSFIGLDPDLIWRCQDDRAEINRRARSDHDTFEPLQAGALESLRSVLQESRIDLAHQNRVFIGQNSPNGTQRIPKIDQNRCRK